MKKVVIITFAIMSIALGATRVYEVVPFKNFNGKAIEIGQTFIATCDSFVWAEVFIGVPNLALQYNYYNIEIQEISGGVVAFGAAPAGDSIQYHYTHANLTRSPYAKVVKGKQYLLKVTHGNGDSINFYYNPNNPYPYGLIYDPSAPAANSDLAARIEGINASC